MKRWVWPGVAIILLLVNLAVSSAFFRQRAFANTLLFERALQVQAEVHAASAEILGVTSPDTPDAQSTIQSTIRHLSDAESACDQLYVHGVIAVSPGDLRTMPRYIQRIREQLETMERNHDYSGLQDVNAAVAGLAGYLDDGLKSYGPQEKSRYLAQFRNVVQAYSSPYPGLR